MKKKFWDFFNRIFRSDSYLNNEKEYYDQWDFYTIFIPVDENTITGHIHQTGKKYHIHSIPPHPHITVHYPFTIKNGFSEDDIFRVSAHILSQYGSLAFSINEILWLHKNRYKDENIIAFGIDQSGDFEKFRIGLTDSLSPHIDTIVPFEKDPIYKTKALPHISIAYELDYQTAEWVYDEMMKQLVDNTFISHLYPILWITMKSKKGKRISYFEFDFKEKRWKK